MKTWDLAVLSAACIIMTLATVFAESQTGLLYCLKDGDEYEAKFVLFKNDDNVKLVYALDSFGSAMFQACSTDNAKYITGDGSDGDPYIMSVKWKTDGTPVSSTDCGRESKGASVYEWYVDSRERDQQSLNSILLQGEYNYLLRCDFSTVTELMAANGSATVKEAGSGVDRVLNSTVEDVDFYIAGEDGNSLKEVQIGKNISLHIKLNIDGDGASGVYATSCRACSDSTCSANSETFDMSKDSGCLQKDQHIGAEDTPFFIAPSADVKSSLEFESFRFVGRGLNVIYFFCRIDYCFGAVTDKCTSINPCNLRRRRASDEKKEKEVKTFLIIRDGSQSEKQQSDNVKDKTVCNSSTMYMALVVALGVLLLVSLVVIIAIFVRVNRLRNVGKTLP